jgi:CHAD domain-containing protein
MPYRLHIDERVQDGLRRCAREQLGRAVEDLTTGVNDDPVEAVHDARKALKKTRSLLRLSGAAIDGDKRRRENAALRHAAGTLSAARDAEIMLQAVDELSDRFAGRLPQTTFHAIRRRLEAERKPPRRRLLEMGLTDQVADELRAVGARTDDWTLRRGGWKAIGPGVLRSYRRGRDAFELARSEPTMENVHEWRKRAKDLWYHLRLLKPVSPGIVGGAVDEADRLAGLLGDNHDLAVLRQTLETRAGELAVDLDAVLGLIDHRREQLLAKAIIVGERVYAERPKAFARRLHCYWTSTRNAGRAAETHRHVALT